MLTMLADTLIRIEQQFVNDQASIQQRSLHAPLRSLAPIMKAKEQTN